MKSKLLVSGLMLVALPFLATAQSTVTKTVEKNGKKKTKTRSVPDWAPAHDYKGDQCAYFPDYYMYYEPGTGYVYWNNGAWATSPTVPAYMSSVDMNKARVQILDDMRVRPETKYQTYMNTYPAQRVDVTVPVPGAR